MVAAARGALDAGSTVADGDGDALARAASVRGDGDTVTGDRGRPVMVGDAVGDTRGEDVDTLAVGRAAGESPRTSGTTGLETSGATDSGLARAARGGSTEGRAAPESSVRS
jgi:hypothetical protein